MCSRTISGMSMQFATLGKMPFGGRNELRKSFRILSRRILRAAGICWDGLFVFFSWRRMNPCDPCDPCAPGWKMPGFASASLQLRPGMTSWMMIWWWQVNNTDAEGRLTLADALLYCQQQGVTEATFGACWGLEWPRAAGNAPFTPYPMADVETCWNEEHGFTMDLWLVWKQVFQSFQHKRKIVKARFVCPWFL